MAAAKDQDYQGMKNALTVGTPRPPKSSPYRHIWNQLTVIDELIYKDNKIVLPYAQDESGATNICTKILDIAHEGHPGQSTMKRFARAHVRFPRMDSAIEEIVRGCREYQADTETKHRDPLTPTIPPAGSLKVKFS